ncbi:MAG TPA: YggT family protein [Rhizobiales bacterium]|nr:YggT family protein [Hyphomicrobiales bacterium]
MHAILSTLITVIDLYIYVIIGSAIFSWLIAFSVVNTQNKFVYMVYDVLYRLTEPALAPIRRFMPSLGGLDLSPVILLLALMFLQTLIAKDIAPLLL